MKETMTKSPGGLQIMPDGFKEFPQPKQIEVSGGHKCGEYNTNVLGAGHGYDGLTFNWLGWMAECVKSARIFTWWVYWLWDILLYRFNV